MLKSKSINKTYNTDGTINIVLNWELRDSLKGYQEYVIYFYLDGQTEVRKHKIDMYRRSYNIATIPDGNHDFDVKPLKPEDCTFKGDITGTIKLNQIDIKQDLHNKIQEASQAMDESLHKGDIKTYSTLMAVYRELLDLVNSKENNIYNMTVSTESLNKDSAEEVVNKIIDKLKKLKGEM